MSPAKKNVAILALCQAFLNSNNSILAVTSALIGYSLLGADKTLATVPVSAMVIGTAVATMPAALLMRRVGRRSGFRAGVGFGFIGAATAAAGLVSANLWVFSAGVFFLGVNTAFGAQYRFAAVDVATGAFKARAISYVLAGGVIAAWAGPEIAKWTVNAVPSVPFLGPYFAMLVLLVLAFGALGFVDIPKPGRTDPPEPAARWRKSRGSPSSWWRYSRPWWAIR